MPTGAPMAPEAARVLSAVELAQDAARAIRDLVEVATPGGDPELRGPDGLRRTVDELALLGHRLPQVVHQLTALLAQQHAAGHLTIDAGTQYAGDPGRAVASATAFLEVGEQLAEQFGAALDQASRALTHASYAGPPAGQPGRGAEQGG